MGEAMQRLGEHAIWPVLLFSDGGQPIELVVSRCGALQSAVVAAVLVQGGVLALLLRYVLLHLAETVARHIEGGED